MTEDEAGTVGPTATGEGIDDVPVLERDETSTGGVVTTWTTDVTAWCPDEGTADYSGVEVSYLPDEYVVKLTSLRDYFQAYRDESISHEDFAQRVFDQLVTLLEPAWLRLTGEAPSRYGIETTIRHDTRGNEPADRDDRDGSDEDARPERG